MRKIFLPKKSGGWRIIYAPNPKEKAALKALVPELNAAALKADKHGVAHGFMPGRSPVTNALAHRGFMYSLSFDLADWFDTVRPSHIRVANTPLASWPCLKLDQCFVDGAARQGLPTSPAIANLAAAPMDNDIMALRVRGRFGWPFVFTRYADDLTFSFDREGTAAWLMKDIPKIVERHGFKINPAKTKLQCARAGRRMITGVAVDTEIHAPRYIKRKLRAATHKAGKNPWSRGQQRGLKEWSMLKLPKKWERQPFFPSFVRQITTRMLNATNGFVRAVFSRKFA